MRTIIILIALIFQVSEAYASGAFSLNGPSTVIVGGRTVHVIKDGETLIELAKTYEVGYNEIEAANKDIDPWVPEPGSRVTVPSIWLLPEIMEEGILINLAEMRLYFFFNVNEKKFVRTFPIGIGREGFSTPTGIFEITKKVKDPVWYRPESIRIEKPELPASIPPGPDNPLGKYWIQFSDEGHGIHGTNRPYGVGRRVSHGCIRLYDEDIEALFNLTTKGMPVRVINEPVKIGSSGDKVYIEVHDSDIDAAGIKSLAMEKLGWKGLLNHIDTERLDDALKSSTGLPVVISN